MFWEACLTSACVTLDVSILSPTEKFHFPDPVTSVAFLWVFAAAKTVVGCVVAVPLRMYASIGNFNRHLTVPLLWLLNPSSNKTTLKLFIPHYNLVSINCWTICLASEYPPFLRLTDRRGNAVVAIGRVWAKVCVFWVCHAFCSEAHRSCWCHFCCWRISLWIEMLSCERCKQFKNSHGAYC